MAALPSAPDRRYSRTIAEATMNRRAFLHTAFFSFAAFALLGAAPAQKLGDLSTAWKEAAAQKQLLIVIIASDPTGEAPRLGTDWSWAAADWLLEAPTPTLALLARSRVIVARRSDLTTLLGKAPPAVKDGAARMLVVKPASPASKGWVRLPDAALHMPDRRPPGRRQPGKAPPSKAPPSKSSREEQERAEEKAKIEVARLLKVRVAQVDQAFRAALAAVGATRPAGPAAPAYTDALQEHAPEGGQWCWPGRCGPARWEGDPASDSNHHSSCGMGHIPDSLSSRFLGLLHRPI